MSRVTEKFDSEASIDRVHAGLQTVRETMQTLRENIFNGQVGKVRAKLTQQAFTFAREKIQLCPRDGVQGSLGASEPVQYGARKFMIEKQKVRHLFG